MAKQPIIDPTPAIDPAPIEIDPKVEIDPAPEPIEVKAVQENCEWPIAMVFATPEEAKAKLDEIDASLGYPDGHGTDTWCDIRELGPGQYMLPLTEKVAEKVELKAAEVFETVLVYTDEITKKATINVILPRTDEKVPEDAVFPTKPKG